MFISKLCFGLKIVFFWKLDDGACHPQLFLALKFFQIPMYRNYLKIAFRKIYRDRVFALINILGLAVGMAAFILILQYVFFELSYDRFHPDSSQVYRVVNRSGPRAEHSAQTPPLLAPLMQETIPEAIASTRMTSTSGIFKLSSKDKRAVSYRESEVYFADEHFFEIFPYSLKYGDARTALKEPNALVLTTSVAEKYFGKQNPMGKTLTFYDYNFGEKLCTVKGVMADPPPNTHLKTEILVSLSTTQPNPMSWANLQNPNWTAFYSYIRLKPHSDPQKVEAKLGQLINNFLQENNLDEAKLSFQLQALADIHLYSKLNGEAEANGSMDSVVFLSLMAAFILLIAWINYINMTTARSVERAKEVGVRKVIGAKKAQLVYQFLLEASVINLMAGLISVFMVDTLGGLFKSWIGKPLPSLFAEPSLFLGTILGIFLWGALLSGVYPAFVLSAFRPVKVLRSNFKASKDGLWLRKTLVIFQYTACIALVIGSAAVHQQLLYMQNKDLGMSLEQILVVEEPRIVDSTYARKASIFKDQLKKYSAVEQVSYSGQVPSKGYNWGGKFQREKNNQAEAVDLQVTYIDTDFVATYDMRLKAGQIPNANRVGNSSTSLAIINERAALALGFSQPQEAVRQTIYQGENAVEIVGVLQDYHHRSLKENLEPIVFFLREGAGYCSIKLKLRDEQQDWSAVLAEIEEAYLSIFPQNPYHYFFIDEVFNRQYQADLQFGNVMGLFTILAVLVASLGLFGLASFSTLQRTKEIGIRKILGASLSQLLVLLSADFIRLVLWASVLALPLSYWFVSNWLQNYAYRIDLHGGLFLMPVLAVILLALLTVSYQTIRTARSNPIDSLRYE